MVRFSSSATPNLVDHLLRLCRALRSRGFSIGPGEEVDMFRALEAVDIGDREEFASALRLVLCSSREEQALFDTLFERFLLAAESDAGGRFIQMIPEEGTSREKGRKASPGEHSSRREGEKAIRTEGKFAGSERPGTEGDSLSGRAEEGSRRGGGQAHSAGGEEKWDVPLARVARFSADFLAGRSAAEIPADGLEEMMEAAAALVSRDPDPAKPPAETAAAGKSPPFPPGVSPKRQLGRGDGPSGLVGPKPPPGPVSPFLRRQPVDVPLCRAFSPICLCPHPKGPPRRGFLFSTDIRRITDELRRDARGRLPPLTGLGAEWDGGTRIGESLERFLREHGQRMLGGDSLVIIASDGLDAGETDRLSRSMAELHRRSAGVIWLNPLLSLRGYLPEAEGMKAALPYIDIFSEACDPLSFRKLAKRISFRR